MVLTCCCQHKTSLQDAAELNSSVLVYHRGTGTDRTRGYFFMEKVRTSSCPWHVPRCSSYDIISHVYMSVWLQLDIIFTRLFGWTDSVLNLVLAILMFWRLPGQIRDMM